MKDLTKSMKEQFPEIMASENPMETCKKELRSWKARYARISCSRSTALWYENRITALEMLRDALKKEV